MKRLGNLYEKIYELENLNLAEKNARKGKSRQKQVKNFSKSRELNILSIHEVLKNEEYKVSKYSTFTILIRNLEIFMFYHIRIGLYNTQYYK